MFRLDQSSSVPVYQQIVRRIKELCLRGVFKPGDKLPSVRELSVMVLANPNTVSKAYQELERQGIIETRPGIGTFVADYNTGEWHDHRRRQAVQQELESVVIDAIFAGISKTELQEWIEDQYKRVRERPDAGS